MARRLRIGVIGASSESDGLFSAAIRKAGAQALRLREDDTATIASCDRLLLADPIAAASLEMLLRVERPILAPPGQIGHEQSPLLTKSGAYRFAPFAGAVKSAMTQGRFDDMHIAVSWGQLPTDWARDPAAWRRDAPGVLATVGADCLDLLGWWLGPLAIEAVTHDGLGGPDAEAELRFRGAGASGHIELSRLRQREHTIVITCPRGQVQIDLITLQARSHPADLLSPQRASRGVPPVALQARRIEAWLGAEQLPPRTTVAAQAPGLPAASRLRHGWEMADVRPFPGLRGRNILVVGATGFIGARLVERLAEEQAIVTAVARDMRRAARIARCGVSIASMDATDAAALALVAGQDVVINLAYDLSATAAANAAAAERLARACLAANVRRFVHASSIAVYDGWPDADLTEASPSDGPGHEYKLGKRATERTLASVAQGGAMDLTILQFTNVYGPFSRLWSDEFAERLQAGPVAVPDEALCNGIYLDDAVDALLAASHADAPRGTFIVTGPAPFLWRDLIQGYAAGLGGEVIVEPTRPIREPISASPRKPGFGAALRDPLALARSPLLRPVVDRVRRRIGEERLGLLRRRIIQVLARGKATIYRPASTNPRLFAARATVAGDRAAAALIAPRIGLAPALELCRRYLRWRYGEGSGG